MTSQIVLISLLGAALGGLLVMAQEARAQKKKVPVRIKSRQKKS